MKRIKELFKETDIIRYITVGLTTVLVDIGLLYILASLLQVEVYVAATISFWTSLVYNFLLSKFWTFNVRKHTTYQLVGYGLLITCNYIVGLVLIAAAKDIHQPYLAGKLLALIVTTVWNYLLYKYVIFVEDDKSLLLRLKRSLTTALPKGEL